MRATNVAETGAAPAGAGNPMLNAMRVRDFLLLWIGQGTSNLGDQFMLIALPWLVLQLTGDPLALGAVLALEGIPRALFMLVGGAITDRFSSRTVMLVSDVVRLALTALLAAVILTSHIQMWMLYAQALVFGVLSGFFTPAANSIVPTLVSKDDLQGANAITQGTTQLCGFVGPMLAGGLIALLGNTGAATTANGQEVPGLAGIGAGFAIDAATFVASIITLWMIRARPPVLASGGESVVAAIGQGIAYVWRDPSLRMAFLIIAVSPFLIVGPLLVGIPVLAQARLPEGAVAYGIIMSGYAGGNILGYLLAGAVKIRRMGVLVPATLVLFGAGLLLLGFASSTVAACATLAVLGIGNGYIAILFFTWLQTHTPPEMLGRMMSLLFFFNLGLVPISQALSGALIKLSLVGLFVGAGVLMVLLALWTGTTKEIRAMEL